MHISTKHYPCSLVSKYFIAFDRYIVTVNRADYSLTYIVINYIISNYHILSARVWVYTILTTVMDTIIFYSYISDSIRIERKVKVMYVVISYYTSIPTKVSESYNWTFTNTFFISKICNLRISNVSCTGRLSLYTNEWSRRTQLHFVFIAFEDPFSLSNRIVICR